MLIVCNNWSATFAGLLIFSIRTNSPITCFSIKNLKKPVSYYKKHAMLNQNKNGLAVTRWLTQRKMDHAGHRKLPTQQWILKPQQQNPL